MIMVPTMLSNSNISADHVEAKPSARDRVPETKMDMSINVPVRPSIEYLRKENVDEENKRNAG